MKFILVIFLMYFTVGCGYQVNIPYKYSVGDRVLIKDLNKPGTIFHRFYGYHSSGITYQVYYFDKKEDSVWATINEDELEPLRAK